MAEDERSSEQKKYELKLPVYEELEYAYNNYPFPSEAAVISTGLMFMMYMVGRGETEILDELYQRLKNM